MDGLCENPIRMKAFDLMESSSINEGFNNLHMEVFVEKKTSKKFKKYLKMQVVM